MTYLETTIDTNNIPAINNWIRLERFLIFGSESGTYTAASRPLSIDNTPAVRECLTSDGPRVVRTVVDISTSGRSPKNDPALFVLALASSSKFADAGTNRAALNAIRQVARTGNHLCTFASFVEAVRGWGRGLRSAIADWYLSKPVGELAHQMIKNQHRRGWSHRDLLRLSHPKVETAAHNALFQWAVDGALGHLTTPELASGELRQVYALEQAKKAASESEVVRLIEDYRLTHEMIPAEWKKSARVWEALLDYMPYTVMVRNLGKLTAVGVLAPQSPATALVVARLIGRKRVCNSEIQPISVLSALLSYQLGRGDRRGLRWAPVPNIIDALNEAFYLAFDNVTPTGSRLYVAIDAGSSMHGSVCSGMPSLTAAMGSAVLAMSVARTEPDYAIAAFHDEIWRVDIAPKQRLEQVCEAILRQPRASDASLPVEDAIKRRLDVDAFVIITDNENWAADRRPEQALHRYRRATGIPAKLVVIAMAANKCSTADPDDVLQMNVAGFDAHVPAVIADFIRGGAG